MVKVFIKFDSAIIKEVELTKNVVTFGRKEDNDIILDNPAISGHHGKIFKEGDRYILEDLKSTNGTFVNGNKVTKALLKNKDQIGIARHILEFFNDAIAPAETPPPTVAPPRCLLRCLFRCRHRQSPASPSCHPRRSQSQ